VCRIFPGRGLRSLETVALGLADSHVSPIATTWKFSYALLKCSYSALTNTNDHRKCNQKSPSSTSHRKISNNVLCSELLTLHLLEGASALPRGAKES
jgi:hypothetical protein